MSWVTWSLIGTGIWLLAKKPASAELVPIVPPAPPAPPAPKTATKPVPKTTPAPKPVTVTKTTVVNGRTYSVTRAGLGIYRIALASDPAVFQLISQTGPLQEGGDASKLAQLKLDAQAFPAGLFAS